MDMRTAAFAPPFLHHVESLHHHRIEAHPRQRHSPPRYGQEKRGRRPARDQECVAPVRSQSARTPDLGAGAEKVRPRSRDRARPENDQQKRGLQVAQKSRRDLILWGAHAPRVLAIAPSRSRIFPSIIVRRRKKISARRRNVHARRVRSPEV